MPLGRLLMLFGLVLLPVGLIYGMSAVGSEGKAAMTVELTCLAAGAAIFLFGLSLEKKRR